MRDTHDRATYLWVAETILREHRRPLNVRQIVGFGLERGLFNDKDLSRTPQKSMQARLSMEIVNRRENSKFLRVEKGKFFLRELLAGISDAGNLQAAEYKGDRRAPPLSLEDILVIPQAAYRNQLKFQGLNLNYKIILKTLLSSPELTYIPRKEAELNPKFKQFITYTVIQQKNMVLSFRRGQYNRAASFLRGARCIGFGGHVTADDLNLFTVEDHGLRANAAREISEEIRFKGGRPQIDPNDLEIIGVINDDSSDVGVQHVGVVLRYWAPETSDWSAPTRGEASIAQLRWIKAGEQKFDLLDFEYWSQLVLRKLYPDFVAGRPAYHIVKRTPFQEPHILCVTGSIGSGKSITTRRLCEHYGYSQINSGKVVAELLGIPPVPETPRVEFQQMAFRFITSSEGPAQLASAIAKAALDLATDRVIVDGIRQLRTLEALRKVANQRVATVYVHTPPDVAYKMYALREAQTPNLTLSTFMEIYNAPVESEVRYMISEADLIVYNWIGLDDYDLVVEKFICDLGLGA